MDIFLTLGERLFILWIVTAGVQQGDKTAIRHVAAVQDKLKLDEVGSKSYSPAEAAAADTWTLEKGDWQWLRDKLREIFEGGRCPTQYARLALALDDDLERAFAPPKSD